MESKLKGILRNVDRIEYVKTRLPDGFEKCEEEYRVVKKKLDNFMATLTQLATYEHGGTSYKGAMDKLDIIGEKLKSGFFRTKSLYKEVAEHTNEIGDVVYDNNIKTLARQFGNCFNDVSAAKDNLNNTIQTIVLEASNMKNESKIIDNKRTEYKNMRYDLEKMYKKEKDQDKIEAKKNQFEEAVNTLHKKMEDFIKNKGLARLIDETGKAHYEFFNEAARSLSVFNK
ncbi:Spore wall protein 12 like protein [Spraguea lophii 42_110]|uniref:Spore wall protein 12 like protein n=1 Tax=Spraguea lophii (strain 42_110) TaxID=1358809 RepID=S7W8B7_SPRLO|nr:Spore wall protein 12 like protein [Spraguea lophii 42_110]